LRPGGRIRAAECLVPVLLGLLVPLAASASDLVPQRFALRYALNEFKDTAGIDVAWQLDVPDLAFIRHAQRVEFDVGLIHAPEDIGAILSIGPIWRFDLGESRYFAEFGLAPTVVSLRKFGESDIGGHFHFTSLLSVGTAFGSRRNWTLALQVSHTSNGGLDKPNPGLDMIGISVSTTPD